MIGRAAVVMYLGIIASMIITEQATTQAGGWAFFGKVNEGEEMG
jgi:hypothetical protein